jgi:hypothetical protein
MVADGLSVLLVRFESLLSKNIVNVRGLAVLEDAFAKNVTSSPTWALDGLAVKLISVVVRIPAWSGSDCPES